MQRIIDLSKQRSAWRCADSEPIDEIVHGIAAMAFHPTELDIVGLNEFDQRTPEIVVGDRLSFRVPPPVALPTLPPAISETIDDIG